MCNMSPIRRLASAIDPILCLFRSGTVSMVRASRAMARKSVHAVTFKWRCLSKNGPIIHQYLGVVERIVQTRGGRPWLLISLDQSRQRMPIPSATLRAGSSRTLRRVGMAMCEQLGRRSSSLTYNSAHESSLRENHLQAHRKGCPRGAGPAQGTWG